MKPERVLTEAQERRLHRLFCVGDLGGGRWESVKALLDKGYIVENAQKRIELTPLGREYCQTYGSEMPV